MCYFFLRCYRNRSHKNRLGALFKHIHLLRSGYLPSKTPCHLKMFYFNCFYGVHLKFVRIKTDPIRQDWESYPISFSTYAMASLYAETPRTCVIWWSICATHFVALLEADHVLQDWEWYSNSFPLYAVFPFTLGHHVMCYSSPIYAVHLVVLIEPDPIRQDWESYSISFTLYATVSNHAKPPRYLRMWYFNLIYAVHCVVLIETDPMRLGWESYSNLFTDTKWFLSRQDTTYLRM